jgi:putative MFS transporter
LLPIYAITTYQPTILHSLGLAESNASYLGGVIIQIFFVLGSLSGALVINKGRRKLLLWSFGIASAPLFPARNTRAPGNLAGNPAVRRLRGGVVL